MTKVVLFPSIFLILLIIASGCVAPRNETAVTLTPLSVVVAAPADVVAETSPTLTPLPAPPVASTTAEPPAAPPATSVPATATAVPESDPLEGTAPQRDDVRLAIAFKGLSAVQATPTAEPPPPQIGDRAEFNIGNVDVNTVSVVTAVLQGVGRHAYYWYDEGVGGVVPDPGDLADTLAAFDAIYEDVDGRFGDGTPADDPPVHIVHVSPLALCDVELTTVDQCGLAGYFSSRDRLPAAVSPRSNEREMFVMNAMQIGREAYLDVLAHELRHLIEARYDPSEADWAVEGSAMLAAQLAGYDDSAQWRGNLFLSDPDLQLNTWSDSNTLPHYGQGYLLSRFLYDHLGPDGYRALATSSADGFAALDEYSGQPGYGLALWQDWLAAMALASDQTGVPERFQWLGPPLERVATLEISTLPYRLETTVNQFAADYYDLPSSGAYQIEFQGEVTTPLLPTTAPSGTQVWYALRTNFANPRLTRTVDLSEVTRATLEYSAYVDIEQGYDFAYVSVSEDGGTTWQPLAGAGMQGADGQDDPSESAVADRFYSGRLQRWIPEQIDLSDYAGQVIDLRFEYITDPILTYGGFALDDIRIPEIDFADDAEAEVEGWTAEGFVRVPLTVEQLWHLWLITFADEGVQVEALVPDGAGQLVVPVTALAGEHAPMLVVAAHAPQTLETAGYRLAVEN
jgi:hypothetical protein